MLKLIFLFSLASIAVIEGIEVVNLSHRGIAKLAWDVGRIICNYGKILILNFFVSQTILKMDEISCQC